MILQSKYFTPPLTSEDRRRVYDCLGLSQFEFLYFEIAGPSVLRAMNVKGHKKHRLLRPTTTDELKKQLPEIATPVLLMQHTQSLHQLNERSVNDPHEMSEDLFPFPFNLLSRAGNIKDKTVQAAPAGFLESIQKLFGAFQKLEEQMMNTELSCVWIKGIEGEIPLLFHYVRKKRIRVGTSPALAGLGKKFEHQQLNSLILRELFGTEVSFFYLDTQEIADSDVISGLSAVVSRAVDSSESSIIPQRTGTPVTEMRL